MALEFTNVIKGVVTQTLLTALFERGGYRVTRLGIEELFGEVKHIDLQQYMKLNLPLQLRFIPDLLVAEIDMTHVFLVEVKYRRKFDQNSVESIYDDLEKQRKHWEKSYTVIMVSEPFLPDTTFHQDYVRVVKPNEHEILVDSRFSLPQRWDKLQQLQRVFTRFNNDLYIFDVQKCADTLTKTLRDLAKL
jgi:Holliday junction resolvase-like predicted endonuclease